LTAANPPILQNLPVTTLKGVGPRIAANLAGLGIESVQDILFHLPLRYQDRTRVCPVGGVRPGEQVLIEACVSHAQIRHGRRRSLLVQVSDGSGSLVLRFFHFSRSQQESFRRGVRLRCFGEIRNGPASYEMVHPEYCLLREGQQLQVDESLTPIYPTTEGLQQRTWQALTAQALALLAEGALLSELLPAGLDPLLRQPLAAALQLLHRPPPEIPLQLLLEGTHPAQQRLAFEELLAHQVGLLQLRQQLQHHQAPAFGISSALNRELLKRLPFSLTPAQQRVLAEIRSDLSQERPMQRLVQGDVGSGKTIVAAQAALLAIDSGYQCVIMAPTELLAEQHHNNLRQWLEPLEVPLLWLAGRHKGRARSDRLRQIASGDARLIIGTHALFQSDVEFASLGLVIIDEQHRFGVHQRLALRQKGESGGMLPHQLIMTATPIPRTLAMTAYADLDLSVIDALPPGRVPVTTVALSDNRRDEVIMRVRQACRQGRQAYWVCTLVEESEALQAQAAEETARALQEQLAELRVGLVHGRMSAALKEAAMRSFKEGEIDLLVATTVIEVGVDVANASLMIIENPERLGLAQLHQLRGRVGRGSDQSHCVLLFHAPLGEQARQRLEVMRNSSDGFEIAQKDLEIRGPGEVLGTRQTGELQFRIADVLRDQPLLSRVQQAARKVITNYPQAVAPLVHRWIGQRVKYRGV
jgi:ATP-dependent DNA helicase RecG